MRADMAKVIVERPRVGGKYARRGRVPQDGYQPFGESIKRMHGYNTKELNEFLAPLRRFLHKNVGRKWDDVFSEISENLRPDNTVQQHVRDHVFDFVTILVPGRHGELMEKRKYGTRVVTDTSYELYVDPQDGILKLNPKYESWAARNRRYDAERQAEKAKVFRELKATSQELHKINGVWFVVDVKPLPLPVPCSYTYSNGETRPFEYKESKFDVILGSTIRYLDYPDRRTTYRTNKHQLTKKQLKQYGVTND